MKKSIIACVAFVLFAATVNAQTTQTKKQTATSTKSVTPLPKTAPTKPAPAKPAAEPKKATPGEAMKRKHHNKKVKETMKTKAK